MAFWRYCNCDKSGTSEGHTPQDCPGNSQEVRERIKRLNHAAFVNSGAADAFSKIRDQLIDAKLAYKARANDAENEHF